MNVNFIKGKKIFKKILIITAVLILGISYLFSSGYRPNIGLKNNLDIMELTLYKGIPFTEKHCSNAFEVFADKTKTCKYEDFITYKNSIIIPFKFIVLVSFLLIIVALFL
ncbi:MAG: hypothetical protein A2663_04720 [Candidatus Buchananbacteria bacterium RIFCSPHIGHO2_01_FULL_46_12]|uniref:Uncharacterized protein n=1 Tax=Candidatus Buchananbacteria bacterium RIFCSPHIGHO2_01_FULL_46_12 TaxID=1797536 RepID=A0A1G1YBI6_9BACT|nr:MAG: hypothetical protein A2663_04720 [Candidatus Buchananbacteria bacterium RIFCSPHIGHO2_01_FULL_46_12]